MADQPGNVKRDRKRLRPAKIVTLAIVFLLLGASVSLATIYAGLLNTFESGNSPVIVNKENADWWARNRPELFERDASEQLPMTQNWATCTWLVSRQYMTPEYKESCYRFRFGFPLEFLEGRVWQIHDYRNPHELSDSTVEDYARFLVDRNYKKYVQVHNEPECWIGEPNILVSPDRTVTRLDPLPIPTKLLVWPAFLNWAIWTSIFLFPLLLLSAFIRTIRLCIGRLRGLCPKCGYPMGESPRCTECGVVLPQNIRSRR